MFTYIERSTQLIFIKIYIGVGNILCPTTKQNKLPLITITFRY